MYISLNWIKDFVDISGIDVKELANRITMSTAEVEDVIELGKDINNVVVGKVIEVKPHPESKKLSIVKVDNGDGIIQCVCGAPNVKEGILAPFAKVGGFVKKLEKIGVVKLAGVESHGMLCSASEIGISDDHTGLLILEGDYKPGTDIKEIIDIDDVIIEIDNKSLTNRPDLWGHYGFAREIAALYKRKLKPLPIIEINNNLPKLDIVIEDTQKCYRYSGLTIDNINAKKSSLNMQTRLFYCGMRPISLLVDLSNYIMLEIGQPTHAFDKKFMEKVIVKSTNSPTKFRTLDGTDREIPEDVLLIHNQNGPVAIAGIMGGENTEISEETNSVFLESANFEGPSTRKNATRLGLRTEASARYEKMLDPELTLLAVKRFVKLVNDADKGATVSSSLTDIVARTYPSVKIIIEKSYIVKYMGIDIGKEKMLDILESLEFDVNVNGETFEINVPSFRATKDITNKADIVEEIARIYGYDNIEPETTKFIVEPLVYNEQRLTDNKVKEILSEHYGLSEVHSYLWYDNRANNDLGLSHRTGLRIINSLEGDNETLRDSLAPIMLNFAARNVKNYDQFGYFEIGSVVSLKSVNEVCEEHKNLSILLASKNESEDELFYKLKGIVTSLFSTIKKVEPEFVTVKSTEKYDWIHPTKAAEIKFDDIDLGYISIVHPKIKTNIDKKLNIVLVELNIFKFNDIKEKEIKYKAPSKYQDVSFELSILVDKNISYKDIDQYIKEFKDELFIGHNFVEVYTGKGVPDEKKSMTFSFKIGSSQKTLLSEEIENLRNKLIEYLAKQGYELRK